MSNPKDFFNIETNQEYDQQVHRKVLTALDVNKKAHSKKWWAWLMIPATAVASVLFYLRLKDQNGELGQKLDIAYLLEIDPGTEFEMISDIDVLEELEILEEWDESSDT